MMLNVHELNVELAKIKGDIKMINSHIEIIKTNHLKHIEEDLKNVRRIMWGVGFMMMTQMIVVIREYVIKWTNKYVIAKKKKIYVIAMEKELTNVWSWFSI